MFYRFLSKLATQERLEAFPVPIPGSTGISWSLGTRYYEDKMQLIATNPSIIGVRTYHAPPFGSRPRGVCLRFHQGKETEWLPDIWGTECHIFVSERFKRVIESIDSMAHEYMPIQWIDYREKPIATEQNYYWFNQRRFLSIEPSDRVASTEELGFCPLSEEEDFLARVIDTPMLREQLEELPIWQHYRPGAERYHLKYRCILYINQKLMDSLREEKVTGIDLYTHKFGNEEESLCAI